MQQLLVRVLGEAHDKPESTARYKLAARQLDEVVVLDLDFEPAPKATFLEDRDPAVWQQVDEFLSYTCPAGRVEFRTPFLMQTERANFPLQFGMIKFH